MDNGKTSVPFLLEQKEREKARKKKERKNQADRQAEKRTDKDTNRQGINNHTFFRNDYYSYII